MLILRDLRGKHPGSVVVDLWDEPGELVLSILSL